MNFKTWTPLALAIVLGLIAAKVARDTIARGRGGGERRSISVVVARAPVAPGQELTADSLTMGPISAQVPPPGTFTDPSALVGRITAAPLFAGQPLVETLLAPTGSAAGLQALVPRGMRAITLEVNETSGLAGMIAPGCRVDVMTTLNGATREGSVACTVVQDVLVQAVGQRLAQGRVPEEKDAPPVRSVTLIATPRDAEAIELASNLGRARLVLRGSNDRSLSDSIGVSLVDLRGEESFMPPVVVPVAPPLVVPVPATQPITVAATQPVAPQRAVAATQPITDPFADAGRSKRTVTLIRGVARSEVVFESSGKSGDGHANDAVTSTKDGEDQE
jgi:pilus assembly protein CpaB